MLNEEIKCSFKEIPFKSSLSFEYLITEMQNIESDSSHPLYDSAKKILKEIDSVPELKNTITDFSLVKKHQNIINKLMIFVFNPLEDNTVMASAGAPFIPKPFYSTKLFDQNMRGEYRKLKVAKDIDKNVMLLAVIYQAYLIILKKFYNFKIDIDIPFSYKLTDENDQSVKYFKMLVNPKYTNVKVHGKMNKLTQKEFKSLFDNSSNLDYWNEKIPLDKFEFTGFLHFTYFDITHDFVISQLKSDLLDKQAIISRTGFNRIREKVRALMEIPDLEFGLAAFSDFESNINQNVIWKSILPHRSDFHPAYLMQHHENATQQLDEWQYILPV